MSDKIIVMEKDGVSYVKLTNYGTFGSDFVINGVEAVPAPGDQRYAIVEGTVSTIKRRRSRPRSVVGFALYDRYKEITQLPHELPSDTFYREDGEWCGENAEFYRAVYDDPAPYLELLEFEVIDRNCEPVRIPEYVTIDFPNNIARFTETHHKYPCRIGSSDVFNLLYDRIKAHVAESGGKYVMDDYRSIQALRVEERIALPFNETKTRSYYPTPRSRKPKTETVQVRWKNVKVFEVYGPKYSVSSNSVLRTQTITGANYADLQANLETYIQSFLTQLTDGKREVCRHCRGNGVVDVTA